MIKEKQIDGSEKERRGGVIQFFVFAILTGFFAGFALKSFLVGPAITFGFLALYSLLDLLSLQLMKRIKG